MNALAITTSSYSSYADSASALVSGLRTGAAASSASSGTADNKANKQASSAESPSTVVQLTPDEQRRVAELQQIDRDVRAHEQAHMAAGHGLVTSGASYSYTYGPDGRQYATSGEVGIDTSAEKKAQDNIDKGMQIQSAALAPKDPSAQDYRVAAKGGELQEKGRADLEKERRQAQASAQAQQQVEQHYASVGVASQNNQISVYA